MDQQSKPQSILRRLMPLLGAAASGALLATSFPGIGWNSMAFVGLVPLLYAVQSATPRKAAALGFLAGAVFFLSSLSWLHNLTSMVEGGALKASALLGYAVLALYCALYFVPPAVVASVCAKRWGVDNAWRNLRTMFCFATVWTACEYLRGILFTGFPWNPLGVSQYLNSSVVQIADHGGVYAVSAMIAWLNAAIFITVRQYTHGVRRRQYRPHVELMLGLLPLALVAAYGLRILFHRPEPTAAVRATLVQPDIPQTEKWDQALADKIVARLDELTVAATTGALPDLVIWPETALPDFLRASPSSQRLVQSMAARGAPLLVGTMDVEFGPAQPRYSNSSMLVETNGEAVAKYDKQHLVPFGEYVPFPSLMRKFTPIDVDFKAGEESTLFRPPGVPEFSTLICFEDIVAPLAANAVRAGARWLVNQSNDAWFDPSAQSEQHLAHAVFRCIENRVPMARCCNSGVTCAIDARGIVARGLPVRTKGFSLAEIHPRQADASQTFYTRHGDLFAKLCLVFGIIIAPFLWFGGTTRKRADGAEPDGGRVGGKPGKDEA